MVICNGKSNIFHVLLSVVGLLIAVTSVVKINWRSHVIFIRIFKMETMQKQVEIQDYFLQLISLR